MHTFSLKHPPSETPKRFIVFTAMFMWTECHSDVHTSRHQADHTLKKDGFPSTAVHAGACLSKLQTPCLKLGVPTAGELAVCSPPTSPTPSLQTLLLATRTISTALLYSTI